MKEWEFLHNFLCSCEAHQVLKAQCVSQHLGDKYSFSEEMHKSLLELDWGCIEATPRPPHKCQKYLSHAQTPAQRHQNVQNDHKMPTSKCPKCRPPQLWSPVHAAAGSLTFNPPLYTKPYENLTSLQFPIGRNYCCPPNGCGRLICGSKWLSKTWMHF